MALVSVFLFVSLCEGILYLAGFSYEARKRILWKPMIAGFRGTYEFYLDTEFTPPGYLWRAQPNTEYSDKRGFRLPGVRDEKSTNCTRIAFLGGSTTQGGYRPYPERTVTILNEALGSNRYEVLNAACSSYTTHQSLMALERWVLPLKPDMVVLYHGWNDLDVAPDGFADYEKDPLIHAALTSNTCLQLPGKLRLTQALGKCIDTIDYDWPRPRVPPQQYRENLERIFQRCDEHNIPVILLDKPMPLKPPRPPLSIRQLRTWKGTPASSTSLYHDVHSLYSGLAREVASQHDHVQVFSARDALHPAQQNAQTNGFGNEVCIFREDGCHLFEFGEQQLAEQLALFIAQDQQLVVSNYLASFDYHHRLAHEYAYDWLPFEAVYHAQRALAIRPELADTINPFIKEAKTRYFDYAREFRKGRWGGKHDRLGSKICSLLKCLTLKPDDEGIRLQLARLCLYMDYPERAQQARHGFPTPPTQNPTPVNDGNPETVYCSANSTNDVIIYSRFTQPYRGAIFSLVLYQPPNEGQLIRDVSIVATNDDPDDHPRWHLIRSRLMTQTNYQNRITIPELGDWKVVLLEADPADQDLRQPFKTWGLMCLSETKDYKRNYAKQTQEIGLREFRIFDLY